MEHGNEMGRYPLTPTSLHSWRRCHKSVSKLFTGGPDSSSESSDDENEANLRISNPRLNRYLNMSKDDKLRQSKTCNAARGSVSFDIDSVLAIFTHLSAIRTNISIFIDANPVKNLKHNVHIKYANKELHLIPHFHLGCFGHDPQYDLFVMLPALYDKDAKRTQTDLKNHVPEKVRRAFMDLCFLPSVRESVPINESQGWDFEFIIAKAKSQSAHVEGSIYTGEKTSFKQQIRYELDERDLHTVWKKCYNKLLHDMRNDENLAAFQVTCSEYIHLTP